MSLGVSGLEHLATNEEVSGSSPLRHVVGAGDASNRGRHRRTPVRADQPLRLQMYRRVASLDSEEKIQSFLPVLDQMMGGGLLTLEKVKVIDYRAGPAPEEPQI